MNQQSRTDTQRVFKSVEFNQLGFANVERDVVRGRKFDYAQYFLPEGLCRASRFGFLDRDERRLVSQIQGRTYARMMTLINRDEEALFGRIAGLVAEGMADGYRFVAKHRDVVEFIRAKSTWATLGLAYQLGRSAAEHYHQSIVPDPRLSSLYKDVFFYRWKHASQRTFACEVEWSMEDAHLSGVGRDHAVNDLIELLQGVHALLLFQAPADVDYFVEVCNRSFSPEAVSRLEAGFLDAYRRQFVATGTTDPRFGGMLRRLANADQVARIYGELRPILSDDEASEYAPGESAAASA